MAETNGHAPALELAPIAPATASAEEFDALLSGLFEPRLVELAPGRTVEIRPLILEGADVLYGGLTGGMSLQRFMLSRCVYINGRPLGELAGRLPVAWANRLVPLVMEANGMDMTPAAAGGEAPDPKA
jgi:hypothetical protein